MSNTVTNYYYTKLEKELFNANIAFINLSGGVGIAYKPDQIPNDISIIGNNVHKIYNEILAPEGIGNIPTHTEMGIFVLALYGAYYHIIVLGKENDICENAYDIEGFLCENWYKFAIGKKLPVLNIGDYLFIHDAGDNGYSMGYNY